MKTTIACFLAVVAFMVLGVWLEWRMWTECRSDHSFLYCVRVLGH